MHKNHKPATLYHMPLTCSLAVRIAAAYGNVPIDVIEANNLPADDYKNINPLGQVSTLITPSGEHITETSAALMWVQSQSADNDFRRTPDDDDYYQLIRWIGFTATEIHKQIYRMVFYDELDDRSKDNIRALAPSRFALIDEHLATRDFLLGDHFSAADAYLCWAMLPAKRAGLDPSPYMNINRYTDRIHAIPSVDDMLTDDWERKQAEMAKSSSLKS